MINLAKCRIYKKNIHLELTKNSITQTNNKIALIRVKTTSNTQTEIKIIERWSTKDILNEHILMHIASFSRVDVQVVHSIPYVVV